MLAQRRRLGVYGRYDVFNSVTNIVSALNIYATYLGLWLPARQQAYRRPASQPPSTLPRDWSLAISTCVLASPTASLRPSQVRPILFSPVHHDKHARSCGVAGSTSNTYLVIAPFFRGGLLREKIPNLQFGWGLVLGLRTVFGRGAFESRWDRFLLLLTFCRHQTGGNVPTLPNP